MGFTVRCFSFLTLWPALPNRRITIRFFLFTLAFHLLGRRRRELRLVFRQAQQLVQDDLRRLFVGDPPARG